ncbi:MAG: response regulator transcription factor [Chloroflexi bacterium]|nr:response regulator transcription factor [Chloroflexota bacterium]
MQRFIKKRILVIDDDADLVYMLKISLEKDGYAVFSAHNGLEGIKLAFDIRPHLIILDLMMPQMDGYEACSRLREMTDIPILLLTSRTQKDDIVRGFQEGADDYVTKPFSQNELKARVRALLRRNGYEEELIIKYNDEALDINLETQKVFCNGTLLKLTTTEFNVLGCLVAHSGQVVPYREIIRSVWGNNYGHTPPLVQTYIAYLRKKLKKNSPNHQYIRTQWGKGYWFAARENTKKGDFI